VLSFSLFELFRIRLCLVISQGDDTSEMWEGRINDTVVQLYNDEAPSFVKCRSRIEHLAFGEWRIVCAHA
jgi:hypothetical protein